MNYGILFGKLLNYPDCCTDWFLNKGGWSTNGDVSYHGFVPCKECAKLSYEELVEVIGRDLKNPPKEFTKFTAGYFAHRTFDQNYQRGLDIYKKAGKEDFFVRCWNYGLTIS